MAECIHEIDQESCGYCRTKVYDGPYWDANFEGVCKHPGCHKLIDVGDRLRWNDEGTGVIHASHKHGS